MFIFRQRLSSSTGLLSDRNPRTGEDGTARDNKTFCIDLRHGIVTSIAVGVPLG